MWLVWVVFALVTLASARYFRQYWKRAIYIHTSVGIASFVITVVALLMAWFRNWNISGHVYIMYWRKYSAMFENIAGFYAIALMLSGMVAWFWRRYGNYEWGTTPVLQMGKFHRYFSHIFLFFVQGLILFAIMDNFAFMPQWIFVSIFQFVVAAIIFIVLEYRF